MIMSLDKEKCTGCFACVTVCPNKCIVMQDDAEGFWYPAIDNNKCVQCKLCERVCPVLNQLVSEFETKNAYAVVNCDENIRVQSSSGGFFSIVALYVLKNNGVVVGAMFNPDFQVSHAIVKSVSELYKLRGSKYVQSRVDDIYFDVKKYLDMGIQVLFTGTACQIQGLKAFLGISRYTNLLLCIDIICHGVPSPKVWQAYIKRRETISNSQTKLVSFRSKYSGWKKFALYFEFKNNTIYRETVHKDLFMRGFLADIYLRQSCYNCSFKTKNRISDFTIADLWGVEKIAPDIDDDKGTSLVIIQSKQGERIFDSLKNQMYWREISFDAAIKCNKSMIYSALKPAKRADFFRELPQCIEIESLIYKYIKPNIVKKIYLDIRHFGGNCLRQLGLRK